MEGAGYLDLGFAKLDTDRVRRTGFPEVVFCEGKEDSFLLDIFSRLYEKNGLVMGTRASRSQASLVASSFPQSRYDPLSRIVRIGSVGEGELVGNIAVCTAGTADVSVAEEAAQTAEFFGSRVTRIYDVGVSGIHRLLSRLDELGRANAVIAAAGMEGALASVVGGLVSVPVIALPARPRV